jgi:hypothetical protein
MLDCMSFIACWMPTMQSNMLCGYNMNNNSISILLLASMWFVSTFFFGQFIAQKRYKFFWREYLAIDFYFSLDEIA